MRYYKIADLSIGIDLGYLPMPKELTEFEVKDFVGEPDIRVNTENEIHKLQELLDDRDFGNACLINEIATIYELNDVYTVTYNRPRKILGFRIFKNTAQATIYVIDAYDENEPKEEIELGIILTFEEAISNALMEIFFFFAQQNNRIAVHSASIIYENKAWLFSALSGVGKSTHIDMWQEAGYGFEVLNGDVAMCYIRDGKAVVAGIPWCGSSGQTQNTICDFGGVFFIRQSPTDQAIRLESVEGILRLNARCFTPNWNTELVDKNVDLVDEIENQIGMFELQCTPTVNAARVSKAAIDAYLMEGQ